MAYNGTDTFARQFEILDHLPIGSFVLEQNNTVVFWSRAVERWTKIRREDILGQPITNFFPHFSESSYARRLEQVFRGGPPVVFSSILHKTLLSSSRTNVPQRLHDTVVSSIRLENGNTFGALFAIQDITQFFNLFHDYRLTRDQAIEEMLEHKNTGEEIQRINQKLGRRIIQKTAALAQRTAALVASEDRYRSLFENVPVAIWEVNFAKVLEEIQTLPAGDEHGLRLFLQNNPTFVTNLIELLSIENVNKVALEMYCADDKSALIKRIPLYSGKKGRDIFIEKILTLSSGEISFAAEYPSATLKGEQLFVGMSALIAPGSEHSWEKVLISVRDISVQKVAEMALRDAHQKLEARVRQRTAELSQANQSLKEKIIEHKATEQELQKAMAELERSNTALEQFASIASHDLKEPLRKVKTFGERLRAKYADRLEERGLDYLARMEDATSRMEVLINDLLTLSRVTSKAQPFQPIDLAKICSEVLCDLEVLIEKTAGRIDVGNLPIIDADALQMRQLFQNLIGNALKFHRKETLPTVKIYAETSTENVENINDQINQLCKIVIEDNGIGIDQAYYERIFKPFHRLHTRAEYEGTGIGLAVCQKIVQRHGGKIEVVSKPGEGSTFIVLLPVKHHLK